MSSGSRSLPALAVVRGHKERCQPMPASSSLNATRAASFFDRSPATAVYFVPSPMFNAHLSSFDRGSTVIHDLHEAWSAKGCVRNHVSAAGVELVHLVASAFM
jgi:hypothetical protein